MCLKVFQLIGNFQCSKYIHRDTVKNVSRVDYSFIDEINYKKIMVPLRKKTVVMMN